MTIFATKTAFTNLGLTPFHPSPGHLHQVCTICTAPLAVHTTHTTPAATVQGYHAAVRITSCGHVHGRECLEAWLDTGFTCPTCKRLLFYGNDVDQENDVEHALAGLSRHFGEERVMMSVARVLGRTEGEDRGVRKWMEKEIMKQLVSDREGMRVHEGLAEEDFWADEDEEMNFDGDEDMGEDGFGEVEEMRELGEISEEALEAVDW